MNLKELYQEIILDHGKNPRNLRKTENFNKDAKGHNPLCGDKVHVFLKLNDNKKLAGRLHTYMPKFFSGISYCSDSGGLWKHGSPIENSAIKKGNAMQLLTHPEWWQSKINTNRKSRIKSILKQIGINNLNYFKNNFSDFGKVNLKNKKYI